MAPATRALLDTSAALTTPLGVQKACLTSTPSPPAVKTTNVCVRQASRTMPLSPALRHGCEICQRRAPRDLSSWLWAYIDLTYLGASRLRLIFVSALFQTLIGIVSEASCPPVLFPHVPRIGFRHFFFFLYFASWQVGAAAILRHVQRVLSRNGQAPVRAPRDAAHRLALVLARGRGQIPQLHPQGHGRPRPSGHPGTATSHAARVLCCGELRRRPVRATVPVHLPDDIVVTC